MATVDEDSSPNVGIALALVAGAGSATAIGAAVVFFPSFVKYATRKTLAGALGLSAGVMTYVSFVEIFQKSKDSFADAGFEADDEAYVYATLCFFGGVVFMVTLNHCVTALLRGEHHHHHSHAPVDMNGDKKTNSMSQDTANPQQQQQQQTSDSARTDQPDDSRLAPQCPCSSEDPAKDLESWKQMAEEMEARNNETDDNDHTHEHSEHGSQDANAAPGEQEYKSEKGSDDDNDSRENQETEDAKLMSMSINTALAIGLHNFPEGLATFVATLKDPKVGAVLAIAIAIHNIPEGLCVAMPIYYATGNRWKAFGWACLSGVSEPIAALLGWAFVANSFGDTLYGVLFGFVAGMMVIISTRELLPTAHRYDPDDSVVTYCFIGGMCVMALSLVLFVL